MTPNPAQPVRPAAPPTPVVPKPVPATSAPTSAPPAPNPGAGNGPRPTLTIHFLDADGFECDLTFPVETMGTALGLLKQTAAHLKNIGARPRPTPAFASSGVSSAGGEAPRCKYHGGAMKQGRGGKWFCPKKIQGGAYCDYTVGEEAPKAE